jgi:hypothetical protein
MQKQAENHLMRGNFRLDFASLLTGNNQQKQFYLGVCALVAVRLRGLCFCGPVMRRNREEISAGSA